MARRAVELMQSSVASNTKKAYQSAVDKYNLFCECMFIPQEERWPPGDSTVACWIAWMSDSQQDLQLQTIRSYMSGLTKFLHSRCLIKEDESIARRPIAKQCMEGLERRLAQEKPSKSKLVRRPLSLPMLKQVVSSLPAPDKRSYVDHMVLAGLMLTFGGGFRAGEIFPCDGKEGLAIRNLFAVDDSFDSVEPRQATMYCARLTTSKANQKDSVYIPISIPSAVEAITSYLLHRPSSLDSLPVFITQSGKPLTRTSFVSSARIYLKGAGVSGIEEIYGHSFRKGFAQQLRDSGYGATTIKRYGRWRSVSHLLYHIDRLSRLAKVGRSLEKSSVDD
jgi:integrase